MSSPSRLALAALAGSLACSCGASREPTRIAAVPDAGPAAVASADRDSDRVPDAIDKCPGDPEDLDGWNDDDGCLDEDNDEDGIPDVRDSCPAEPESCNGVDDKDGCPDQVPMLLHHGQMVIIPYVYFDLKSTKVRAVSNGFLDKVASKVAAVPTAGLRIFVAGMASPDEGSDEQRLRLSRERAEAVADALARRGVARSAVGIAGFGDLCRREEPDSPSSRELERSVRIALLEAKGECMDEATTYVPWCEAAISAGLVPSEDRRYFAGSGYCELKERRLARKLAGIGDPPEDRLAAAVVLEPYCKGGAVVARENGFACADAGVGDARVEVLARGSFTGPYQYEVMLGLHRTVVANETSQTQDLVVVARWECIRGFVRGASREIGGPHPVVLGPFHDYASDREAVILCYDVRVSEGIVTECRDLDPREGREAPSFVLRLPGSGGGARAVSDPCRIADVRRVIRQRDERRLVLGIECLGSGAKAPVERTEIELRLEEKDGTLTPASPLPARFDGSSQDDFSR
jgi:outer membrane protein OmpA-like peptidoglycan-associated protein